MTMGANYQVLKKEIKMLKENVMELWNQMNEIKKGNIDLNVGIEKIWGEMKNTGTILKMFASDLKPKIKEVEDGNKELDKRVTKVEKTMAYFMGGLATLLFTWEVIKFFLLER